MANDNLLLAGDLFRRRLVEIAGPTLSRKRITLHILDGIAVQVSRYLFVRVLISVIVAAATFLAFWLVGLAQPGVWGVAAGLLNVIPYLGPAVFAGAAGITAFLQFHTLPPSETVAQFELLSSRPRAALASASRNSPEQPARSDSS